MNEPEFREKSDYELDKLPDEQLIEYVVAARRAGKGDAGKLGLGVFANRRFDDLARRARRKLPTREDAEDVAAQVIEGAFRAAFAGEFYGEAVAFLSGILHNKIVDFYRKHERTEALPEEQGDDERKRPDAAISPDETAAIDLRDVIERRVTCVSAHHRLGIDLFVFDGHDATDAAAGVNDAFPELEPPMSDQNVHKIASRFRKDLRSDLEGS